MLVNVKEVQASSQSIHASVSINNKQAFLLGHSFSQVAARVAVDYRCPSSRLALASIVDTEGRRRQPLACQYEQATIQSLQLESEALSQARACSHRRGRDLAS